jgi:predicted nucleic acid-binding protein
MYLLDTNILPELRKLRPHGAVVSCIEGIPDADLHISAVTLGEIQAGTPTRHRTGLRRYALDDAIARASTNAHPV